MPVISRFYGIVVKMYLRQKEHNPPHIHAIYGEYIGLFSLKDGEMFEGDILEQSLTEVHTFKTVVNSLIESRKVFITKSNVDIRSQGTQNLLNENEQKSIKQPKKIVSLLSDKEELANVVKNEENDIAVKIAGENEKMEGCALISAPIIIKGTPIASIAVIGPDRMDYANIAQALKIVMSELKEDK